MTNDYRTDYPNEPIGGSNPYYCCKSCGIPDPEINGEVKNHADWCEWRKEYETKS